MSKLNLNVAFTLIEEVSFDEGEHQTYSPSSWDEVEKIHDQYVKFISRTSSYHCELYDHVYNKHGLVYRHKASYVVGNYYDDVFVLSHFAPKSLREGIELMQYLAYKESGAVVLAVPHYQAKMAIRCGWDLVGLTWQEFGGTLVQKVVLCNRAMPNDKYWELRERLELEAALRKPHLP